MEIKTNHVDTHEEKRLQEKMGATDLNKHPDLVNKISHKYAGNVDITIDPDGKDLHQGEVTDQNASEVLKPFQRIARDPIWGVKLVQAMVDMNAPYEDVKKLSDLLEQLDKEQKSLEQQQIDVLIADIHDAQVDITGDISKFESDLKAGSDVKEVAGDFVKTTAEKMGAQVTKIDETITKKIESMPKDKYEGLKDALKEGNFREIMKKFSELLSRVFDSVFGAGGKDGKSAEGLFNTAEMDFSKHSCEELACPRSEIEVEEDGDMNYKAKEGTLIYQLEAKRNEAKKSGDLVKEVMYAAALSKAKDSLYAKVTLGKEEVTPEQIVNINSQVQYKRLQSNMQPGDMLFFVNGGSPKRYEKLLHGAAPIPADHVGVVGDPKTNLYHSTMKTYDKNRNGVHKVDVQKELGERGVPLNLMVVRTGWSPEVIQKVLTKAEEMHKNEVKYDSLDAATSMVGVKDLNEKSVNCGSFVNQCFKESPMYSGVERSGVPTNLLSHEGFSVEYVTKYTK